MIKVCLIFCVYVIIMVWSIHGQGWLRGYQAKAGPGKFFIYPIKFPDDLF